MNEEFASDSESDDLDFCPDNEKLGKSDSDSIDEKDEAINDVDDDESSKKKRKKKKPQKSQAKETYVKLVAPVRDLEAEKRKEDALWAEFLGGSESPAKPDTSSATTSTSSYKKHIPKEQKSSAPKQEQKELPKDSVFEFAGEEVVVQQNVSNSTKSSSTPAASSAGIKRSSNSGGGLSSVLNQITKKNKLSILEKTKIDWDGFKTNEGIIEDIATHNRGRDG